MEKHRTEVTEVTEDNRGIRDQNSNVSADCAGDPVDGATPYHGPGFRPTVVANFDFEGEKFDSLAPK
jgi:hypothetical protein